jgi:hypothetical protein
MFVHVTYEDKEEVNAIIWAESFSKIITRNSCYIISYHNEICPEVQEF